MPAPSRDVRHRTGSGFLRSSAEAGSPSLDAISGASIVRWLLLLCLTVLAPACSDAPEPITLDQGTVVVLNQTGSDWRNVVITVNDHFRGGTPTLAAGGRMAAPLPEFQTAFGQHFDRNTQSVAKVELTATDASGKAVALAWNGARAK